ncbi:Dihydrodipicolinate synthase [Coemansia thaxteri]|nr:Dihydrodipicolinate synthase [Coemansia thaxteri]KAJ2473634.1 Dihydrodipicolinate synthase [Coemansia sp. RSA 2322]
MNHESVASAVASATASIVEAAATAGAAAGSAAGSNDARAMVGQFLRSLVPDFTSPVQLVLLGLAGYFAVRSAKAAASNSSGAPKFTMASVEGTAVATKRDFTPAELAVCDGRDEDTALHIAVRRVVYDVSKARGFYGPGGPYCNFAGRDASRGLARGEFDTSVLTELDEAVDSLEDLDKGQNEALDEWATFFAGKYVPVGRLVDTAEGLEKTKKKKAEAEKKAEEAKKQAEEAKKQAEEEKKQAEEEKKQAEADNNETKKDV